MRLLYLLTLVATTFLLHSRPYYIVDYRWTNDKAWNSEEHPGHFRQRYHSEDRGSRDTYGGGGGYSIYARMVKSERRERVTSFDQRWILEPRAFFTYWYLCIPPTLFLSHLSLDLPSPSHSSVFLFLLLIYAGELSFFVIRVPGASCTSYHFVAEAYGTYTPPRLLYLSVPSSILQPTMPLGEKKFEPHCLCRNGRPPIYTIYIYTIYMIRTKFCLTFFEAALFFCIWETLISRTFYLRHWAIQILRGY